MMFSRWQRAARQAHTREGFAVAIPAVRRFAWRRALKSSLCCRVVRSKMQGQKAKNALHP
jgi:hypothetical protein